jgi:hypothetical protein
MDNLGRRTLEQNAEILSSTLQARQSPRDPLLTRHLSVHVHTLVLQRLCVAAHTERG